MVKNNRFLIEELPESPYARQMNAGIPWLTFEGNMEAEFRANHLIEGIRQVRVNLCLAISLSLAMCAVDALLLGTALHRLPSIVLLAVVVPTLSACLVMSFSKQLLKLYVRSAVCAASLIGLAFVGTQVFASLAGVAMLFPSLILATIFTYLMSGLMFYQSLAVNGFITAAYLAAGTALSLPTREFGYDAFILVAINLFCASIVYMHEKTDRLRFLQAGLLNEMVARDGLTGIQNRRMFDRHIALTWQQGVREAVRVAVLLVDIDFFKNYNDRYGHQAGDQCLCAVARSLGQCARRPMDFVARYGGEEFAVILYDCNREYVADVLTRIQRGIAQLALTHDASSVANRLTVSIGAAFVLPGANRTAQGLVQLADEALYSAKEQGRNRVVLMEAEYQSLRTGMFQKRRVVRPV